MWYSLAKSFSSTDISQCVSSFVQEPVPQMQGNPNAKRKVAVLIAYNGKGYHGIQRC